MARSGGRVGRNPDEARQIREQGSNEAGSPPHCESSLKLAAFRALGRLGARNTNLVSLKTRQEARRCS